MSNRLLRDFDTYLYAPPFDLLHPTGIRMMKLGREYKVVCPLFLDKDPDFEEGILQSIATFHPYKCTNQEEVAQVVKDADAVITGLIE